jgi:oligopeptide transport system permease protein
MLIYIFRRISLAVPMLLVLMTLVFFLLRLAPGGPFDADQVWPPEIQANINHQYELDLPIWTQYLHWVQGVMQGNLRESFQYIGTPVSEMIRESLPISLQLGSLALVLAILIGIPLGALAAWRPGSLLDRLITLISIAGVSLPSYLVASVLILVFSIRLGWLPPALWEEPASMILPILTLAWRPMSLIARLVRTSLIEEMGSDYVRTAHGKGVHPAKVILKHAMKNSLLPVVSLLGPIAANLLTGSFIVEVIFQIPGMGKYFVQAVLNRDYPLVMGVTLTYGVILILSNLVADLLYGSIDPRVRLENRLGETA